MKRSNFLGFSLTCLYICLGPVQAIYESQAGVFDWHQAWIGKPRWMAHYQHDAFSHVIISTERNVLASLDASTGAIDWRQHLEDDIEDAKLTSQGIITVYKNTPLAQHWDAKTGKLIWQQPLGSANNNNNMVLVQSNQQGVIVLSGGSKVYKLNIENGAIEWEQEIATTSIGAFMLKLVDQVIFVIQTPEPGGDKASSFHVFGLDQRTGQVIHSDLRVTSQPTTFAPIVHGNALVWKEKDLIKWNVLGTKKVHQVTLKNLLGSASSFTNTLEEHYQLTTTENAQSGDVFFIQAKMEVDDEGIVSTNGVFAFSSDGKSLELVKDLGIQTSFGAVTKSNGKVVRIGGKSPLSLVIDEFDSTKAHKSHEIEFDNGITGDFEKSLVLEGSSSATLILVSTSSGSLYMLNNKDDNNIVWSREEALAHTIATEFLDLPEKQMWTQVDEDEVNSSARGVDHQQNQSPFARYIRRLTTHLMELQNLPSWLVHHFIDMGKPILTSSISDDVTLLQAQSCWNGHQEQHNLYRDPFGMRKLLVSVTSTGKILAQDSGRRGKIMWTRYMPGVSFKQVYVVRTAAVKLPPVIVALGTSNDGATTHFYRLNGLTGQDYVATSTDTDVQDAFDPQLITETGVAKVMMLPIEEPDEHTHVLALYDAGTTRVFIYPGTDGARVAADPFWSNFYFQHTTSTLNQQQTQVVLKGYQVVEGYRHSLTAQPVWNIALPKGEELLALDGQRQRHQAASLGRVLGNRNVFYKYLNPNMMTMMTGDAERQTLTVRVIDSVKGTILYEAVHANVPASSFTSSVHMVQMENWIVYHFWSNDGKDTGYQAVVLELYEGALENQRVPSTNFSSYDPLQPSIQSAAFAFPYAVQAMGVTTTRNGVSTRDILFALPSNQILTVNKRLLDPRRPTAAPSKDDQEEQLIPYAPIPEERKMFLTYNLEVMGIQCIISAPALLESTSLIYAFGLDSYYTRDSPSRQFDVLSEDFSKSQLLLTIIALVVGILVAGPIVRRKQVNALWQ